MRLFHYSQSTTRSKGDKRPRLNSSEQTHLQDNSSHLSNESRIQDYNVINYVLPAETAKTIRHAFPKLAEVLHCQMVVTEMTAMYTEHEKVQILGGTTAVVLAYEPAKTHLEGRSAGKEDVEFQMTVELYNFLMSLTEQGLGVEEEYAGVLWKFAEI